MKNPWVIVGIITVVLFGGAIWFSSLSENKSNEGIEILHHVKGNPDGKVALLEYSDFQCPACAAFQPVINQILEDYGDEVSFEYRHFPLTRAHPHALPAAVAAEAAGQQGKFFEFHDILFERQSEWSGAGAPNALFIKYAEEIGLEVEQFRSQMRSSALRDKVMSELNQAMELQLTGTPSFFLNGEKMQFETFQEFVAQIAFIVEPEAFASSTEPVPQSGSGIKFGI